MNIRGLSVFAALFLTAGFIGGCSGKNKLSHEESCNQKFEKLHVKFEKEKYSVVREPLSDLLNTCPGYGFIEQALFELAESHYNLKEWVEAQAEYKNLLRDFPNSKFGEKAFFKLAVCSHKRISSVGRDQEVTREAIENYRLFTVNYPESGMVDSANTMMDELKTQLANKDLHIARMYLKLNEPQAAAIYLKSVLKDYEKLIDLKQLNFELVNCYIALNQFDIAETYLTQLKEADSDEKLASKIQKLSRKFEKKKSEYNKKK